MPPPSTIQLFRLSKKNRDIPGIVCVSNSFPHRGIKSLVIPFESNYVNLVWKRATDAVYWISLIESKALLSFMRMLRSEIFLFDNGGRSREGCIWREALGPSSFTLLVKNPSRNLPNDTDRTLKTSSGSYLENSTISVGIGLKKLQTRSSSVSVKSLDGGHYEACQTLESAEEASWYSHIMLFWIIVV